MSDGWCDISSDCSMGVDQHTLLAAVLCSQPWDPSLARVAGKCLNPALSRPPSWLLLRPGTRMLAGYESRVDSAYWCRSSWPFSLVIHVNVERWREGRALIHPPGIMHQVQLPLSPNAITNIVSSSRETHKAFRTIMQIRSYQWFC